MTDAPSIQVPELFGLVLTGGRSRRFGRDKAALEIGGDALLDRTAKLLAPLVIEVFVSVRDDQLDEPLRAQYAPIVDQAPGLGPAAGLMAAHAMKPDAAWFVVACDLPNLDGDALSRLCRARDINSGAIAYASPVDGGPEPLCAIYEPVTLSRFTRLAESGGSLSPRDFLAGTGVRLLEASDRELLANINSQDDLKKIINDE